MNRFRSLANWSTKELEQEIEARRSLERGLKQKGTIDRGSFAQYATETVTTSKETKDAICGGF